MTPVLQEPPSHPTGSASFRLWLYLGLIAIAALTDAVNSTILVVAREHLMGSTHSTPDEIAAQVDLPVAEVQHQILLLTLQGIVAEDEGGVLRYQAPGHD